MGKIKSHFQSLAVIFLGVCLVISSWLISDAIKDQPNIQPNIQIPDHSLTTNKYEFIPVSENHFIILDTGSGTYLEKKDNSEDWTINSP